MSDGQSKPGKPYGCLADWGPDTLAASCNVCGFACWVGAARVRALMPSIKIGQAEPPAHPTQTNTSSMSLELWWIRLAYDGTDYAGWQKQSEAIRKCLPC